MVAGEARAGSSSRTCAVRRHHAQADQGTLEIQAGHSANALRMDDEEVDAFRAYVKNGGKLYASGNTSLIIRRAPRGDFMLADVFGCSFEKRSPGGVSYVKGKAGNDRVDCATGLSERNAKAVPSMSIRIDARATGIVLRPRRRPGAGNVVAALRLSGTGDRFDRNGEHPQFAALEIPPILW